MNSGIINRCVIFMHIEKLAFNCVFFVAKYPNFCLVTGILCSRNVIADFSVV